MIDSPTAARPAGAGDSLASDRAIPVVFGPEQRQLFGWYHPAATIAPRDCAVVLCSPLGRETTGIPRAYRHWANALSADGFATMRFDLHGTGDSSGRDEDPHRLAAWIGGIVDAVAFLRQRSGARSIVLAGVHFGGTLALAAAVELKDVDGLAQALASGTVAIQGTDAGAAPVVDGNTVFALFYPTSTTISEAQGYDSCQSFGGYHADTNVTLPSGQVNFTYALVPRCPDFYASEGLTGVDEVTAGLSHELVEAATDPFTETKAAYLAADDDHKVWGVVLAASEAGDMCSWEMPSVAIPNGVDLKTSRIWSNVAAKAGHDPCVPAPSDPYFNAVPDLSEDVSIPEYISYGADGKLVSGGKTKGVKLAVGESATVDLVIYSDGPTAPITITPQEITTSPVLSLSLDRESGVNGERLHLTITRTAKSAARTGAKILLYSSIGAPTSQSRFGISMIYVAD